ncbi:protein FAR1-RELATED SEQUENCE 5-like [Salvia divinorum]|uniref:Protein FAR1-RELATED SEQUENCE 5-like n=1 Tax=Salvia divinorum TaxID=28513 RepID=A0ABD1ICT2_SALDI
MTFVNEEEAYKAYNAYAFSKGFGIRKDETITSFIWVFETFMEAMGSKAPKTIFTDQDSAMANAIGKELMRQSFDVMSLSVHDVETVKLAKKKLHELDVEIRNYISSVSKSENQTMRNEDNDVPQHGSTQILDPPFHGVTPIEQTMMLNTGFHMNPSHQNMEMSSNMMSIQHAYAQPFSFTSLITQDYQSVPSVPEIMFPSGCPP